MKKSFLSSSKHVPSIFNTVCAMPKMRPVYYLLLLLPLCVPRNSFSQTAVIDFTDYRIDSLAGLDSNLIRLLQPYTDRMQNAMQTVIGFSVNGLGKKQPESGLGNLMADAMRLMAEKKYNRKVDLAFVNYGGIRAYLPKGDITIGQMYELMPYDNLIVLQEIKGSILKNFLDKIAAKDGWPVSGLTMGIKNGKAVNIIIGDKKFSEKTTYLVANTDYIAGGGNDCSMLHGIYQINLHYLFRDALISYLSFLTKQGNSIDAATENRMVYDN